MSEWGLTVSIPKTKAMAVSGSQLTNDVVLPSGASVEMVSEFRYLGGVVSGDGALDREISSRTSKASCAFGCLQGSIFIPANHTGFPGIILGNHPHYRHTRNFAHYTGFFLKRREIFDLFNLFDFFHTFSVRCAPVRRVL